MSDLRSTIVGWADRRIDEMLEAPRMWGSAEAVEMQILQLLEIRALSICPAQELENPRRVLDSYVSHLKQRFPKQPNAPLFALVNDAERAPEFVAVLRDFRDALADLNETISSAGSTNKGQCHVERQPRRTQKEMEAHLAMKIKIGMTVVYYADFQDGVAHPNAAIIIAVRGERANLMTWSETGVPILKNDVTQSREACPGSWSVLA